MVAGIIVAAVGDDAGHVLFKRALLGVLSVARLVAIAALAAPVPVGWVVSPLGLAAMATLVLAAVAGWDSRIQHAGLPIPPTA